jgi:hypothetical protein
MKAYRGTFKKKNGENRDMFFVRLSDMPTLVMEGLVKGTGKKRTLGEGLELVYDLDADGFRIFNWKAAIGDVEDLEISESRFNLTEGESK